MIENIHPPIGYIVRLAQTDDRAIYPDSPLDAVGEAQAEEAGRFLSYERIGKIVSSNNCAAVRMAEIIGYSCSGIDIYTGVEIDNCFGPVGIDGESLNQYRLRQETILSYLAQPEMCLPCVLISYQNAIDALCAYLYPERDSEIVEAGGIISIHKSEVSDMMILQARSRVIDFTFNEYFEAIYAGIK